MTVTAPLPEWLDEAMIDELTAAFVEISDGALEWFGPSILTARGGSGPDLGNPTVENKAAVGFDPVTIADRTIEARLRAAIERRFPDHAIVGEEAERREGTVDVEWIIDPIDGTRAFVSGRPMWGSLIGVSVAGLPVAGWMHQPVLGITHVGRFGETTQMVQGRTMRVETKATARLSDAVLMCTHPSMFGSAEDRARFGAVEQAVQLSRFDGDCANYGFLASGFGDLVIEKGLQPYDIVPLIPIIEGAGGVVTSVDGGSPLEGGWIVAAATAELHAEALALIAEG